MEHPEITKLYKYIACLERVLWILRTRLIYYPTPSRLNDPFDCDIDIASNVSWNQFTQVVRNKGENLNKSREEIELKLQSVRKDDPGAIEKYRIKVRDGVARVREVLRGQGVLSLTANSNSIPMWAYYAEGHRGMCIEFQRLPENVLGSTATRPIHYTDAYPDVSFFDMFEEPGVLSRTVMQTKSSEWKHEQEWRVFVTKGNVLHDLPGEITCVLFGLRTPEEHKREVAKMVSGQDRITLRQAIKRKGRFHIEFVEYPPE